MSNEVIPAELVAHGLVEVKTCPRGIVLFRQDEADGAAYILMRGAIGLYRETRGQRAPIATVRPGEMFGELAVTDGSVRRASAVAFEDSVVAVIPAKVLADNTATADPLLQALLKIFSANLRQVHDSYTPKSRSLLDSVNGLSRQFDVVVRFLRGNAPPSVHKDFDGRLRALEVLVKDMRRLALSHREQDRRDDAVPHEADLPT